MPTSKRQDILNNLKTILEALSILNTVMLNKHIPQDLEEEDFPAVFIYSGGDSEGEGQTSGESETFEWDIEICCFTHENVPGDSSDIEYLIAEVHRAVIADPRILDEVDRIKRNRSDPHGAFDLSGLKTSNILNYNVLYEQPRGSI